MELLGSSMHITVIIQPACNRRRSATRTVCGREHKWWWCGHSLSCSHSRNIIARDTIHAQRAKAHVVAAV